MIDKIIHFSIHNKLIVALFVALLAAWGVYSAAHLPLDAVPDITNNQVQLVTVSPALAPQEVERFITYPVEVAMANLPEVELVRSISRYGLSVVTIVFKEDMETMLARQLVSEKLALLQTELDPKLGLPYMMPITTGLGEIYQYTIEVKPAYAAEYDAMELRSIQDWIVKRRLAGIPGVIEVSSFGGFLKQYEVAVNHDRLRSFNLTIADVFTAVQNNNGNAGGSYIEKGPNAYYVRSEGLVRDFDDLKKVVVKNVGGTPITLGQLAEIRFGHAMRYGAMTKDGEGEAVGGIVLMMKGANANETLKEVHLQVAQLQSSLPEGLELVPYLDRSVLVGKVISTVGANLIEGGLIVVFILILLLGNLRAGLIVASVIPLAMLFALGMMRQFNVSANLMSLGAIDFGLIVDGAVIIVESIVHRLHTRQETGLLTRPQMDRLVYESSAKIRSSAAFGEIIILIVYLPILALVGVEGRMFRPMAMTVGFAILGALILSMTYVPMMSALFLSRKHQDKKNWSDYIMERLGKLYRPVLDIALAKPRLVIGSTLVALIFSLLLFTRLGAVFIPNLEEGDLAMQMTVPPGSSLSQSIAASTKAEAILLANFPEVKGVVSKIGTAEIPTDPMAVEDADIMILMKPKPEWTSASDRETLVAMMKAKLADLPGVSFEFTQPIQLRFNELLTGVKSDIAVKIYGDDLHQLAALAEKAAGLIHDVQGAGDVLVQQTEGLPQLMIRWDRDKIAAYGLTISELNDAIQTAYAGRIAGKVYEGESHFDLVVRLNKVERGSLESVRQLVVRSATGSLVPVRTMAEIALEPGPMLISRENTKRLVSVLINVRDRDYESFVKEVRGNLEQNLQMPPGYFISYGGQFEQLEEASKRLMIAVPVALFLIFLLLYFTFSSVVQAILIFTAIPLSAIGGIVALWLRDLPFSISAGVGFIALFGVAVLNGIVLIAYFNQLKAEGMHDVLERIRIGSRVRLRPVVMTAAVASLGFLPMALSTSNGGEVQRPLATVVIGGLISATFLTLVVLPALYLLVERRPRLHAPAAAKTAGLIVLCSVFSLAAQAQQSWSSPENAIQQTLRNHPDIKQARLDLEQAKKMLKTSWDPGMFEFDWQRGQLNAAPIDNFYTLRQSLGQPALAVARHRYGRMDIEMRVTRLKAREQVVATQVFEAWQAWALAYWRKQALEGQLDKHQTFSRIATARYAQGAISLLAKTVAEHNYEEMQLQLASANNAEKDALAQLMLLLGETPPAEVAVPVVVLLELPAPTDAQITPALRLRELEAGLAAQQIRVQQNKLSPSLGVGYFNQELERVGGFQGVQLTVGIPLWFRPRSGEIQVARLQRESVVLARDYAFASHQLNRDAALRNALNQQQRLNYYRNTAAKRAQLIAANAEAAFQQGEIEYVEYLQALDAVLQIKLNTYETQFQYQLSVYQLRQLLNLDKY